MENKKFTAAVTNGTVTDAARKRDRHDTLRPVYPARIFDGTILG